MDEVSAAADGSAGRGGRAVLTQATDVTAFALMGAVLGSLVLLVPASGRSLVVQAVFFGVIAAYAAVVLVEQRHQRRQREAHERGSTDPVPSADRRTLVRRGLVLLYGAHLAGLCAVGAWPAAVALGLGPVVALVLVLALVRRSRRRELAAARASHPGAAVVLVAPTGPGLVRLAQWARASRTTLPASPGGRGVLVADPDGVSLLGLSRTRPLPRWGWDDVELRRGPHPAVEGGAAIVLTLPGPASAGGGHVVPFERLRDVPLSVRGGAWTVPPPAAVDAALVELLAQRPSVPERAEQHARTVPAPPDDPRRSRTAAP